MRLGLSQVTFEMGIIIKFFNCAVNLQVQETIGGRDTERRGSRQFLELEPKERLKPVRYVMLL